MCDEWKKLRKAHTKGPKRVKLSVERRKNGVDPILTPEHSRRIQIRIETKDSDKIVSVIVLKSVFEQMGLRIGDVKTMKEDKLHKSARSLRKTFDVIGHNERVLNTAKLVNFDNFVRRAWVCGKAFPEYDAKLRITHSDKTVERLAGVNRHVEELFQRHVGVQSHVRVRDTEVEYM